MKKKPTSRKKQTPRKPRRRRPVLPLDWEALLPLPPSWPPPASAATKKAAPASAATKKALAAYACARAEEMYAKVYAWSAAHHPDVDRHHINTAVAQACIALSLSCFAPSSADFTDEMEILIARARRDLELLAGGPS